MQLPQNTVAQSTYTDLNRLNKLKAGEGRDSEENLRQVAQEFESLFISEMMKAMRSANDVLADDLFNSNESKTYRDMYDQQMAVTLSQGKGMGMADVLVRQMSNMQQGKVRPNPFAETSTALNAADGVASESAQASVSEEKSVKENSTQLAAADKPKYVHIADTTDIKFRRFTGIAPKIVAQSLQVQADSGKQVEATASTPQAKQQDGQALRSYAQVKNSLPVPPGQLNGKSRFDSPEEFVEAMLPMAEQAAQRLGVDPKYLVAQAALETGWGKRMQHSANGESSYNLFGIKSHGWKGRSANANTTEYINGRFVKQNDSFRKYDSFAHSFNDYVNFLQQNPRYEKALQAASNAENYVRELQRAGYATDPDYAAKISRIARQIQQQQPVLMAQGPSITERT